jgi:GrpB-like predicted nucleotidyltransferase (UPF0157 family)
MRIEVVPHDRKWAEKYQAESRRLRAILGDNVVSIHHIGSTAIPGILAKPIIDILVEVRDLSLVDAFNEKMTLRGYLPKGEYGIPGRRYFRKGTDTHHTHHVHVFQTGDPNVERHLAFRDYLRTHPLEAQVYSQLKESLALRFHDDPESYMDGKDEFIRKIDDKAKTWKRENAPNTRLKRGTPRNDRASVGEGERRIRL